MRNALNEKPLQCKGMWNGCYGQAKVVAELANKNEIVNSDVLCADDVLDFHGIHVAVFIGNGFMDSDSVHNGVGWIDIIKVSPYDRWFSDPVRVVRWN